MNTSAMGARAESNTSPGRVAVNMLWCLPGRVGGSEQYLVRQLHGVVEATGTEFAPIVFAPRGFGSAHPELASVVDLQESSSSNEVRALRVWRESTWMVARSHGVSLVHHGGGTLPPRTVQPALLTVHDLQYLVYPQYFSRTKLRYLRARLPKSVRVARHVTVPSHYVKRTLIERLGVSEDAVSVVRHGTEPTLGVMQAPESGLRERFGLRAEHVLVYPAVTHPHKNHRFLVELMKGPLRDRDVQVVFAGAPGRADDDLRREIASSGVSDRIRVVGRLGDRDRDGLLSMATALVFPSEYEGFGAPVIEAMALGAPVLAANTTALPEVVGDAGHVLPFALEAWAGAFDDVVARRAWWQERGRLRSLQFRSIDSGNDLAEVYRRVLRRGASHEAERHS